MQATIAVWIVAAGRPEHVLAVNWLNESTPDDQAFFLIQLEAVRIGESQPAPLFTRLAGPTEESKAIGKEKKLLGERHVARLKFWEQLLNRAEELGISHHANRAPVKDSWIGAGAGRTGFTWSYSIWKSRGGAVELYIDNGNAEETLAMFDALRADKAAVESEFGSPLDWQRLEDRRGCRIRHVVECQGLQSPESEWPSIQSQMAQSMDRLVKALGPRLSRLPVA